jgi:hypothetical protein
MIIEVPTTGERIDARLVEERFGPLCLREGRSARIGYVLKPVLDIGWRIIQSTPDEQAIMRSHGILLPNEPSEVRT